MFFSTSLSFITQRGIQKRVTDLFNVQNEAPNMLKTSLNEFNKGGVFRLRQFITQILAVVKSLHSTSDILQYYGIQVLQVF